MTDEGFRFQPFVIPQTEFQQPSVNAMSVDVEDYFHVEALKDNYNIDMWSGLEHRVEKNTHQVLDLFSETNVKATFFTLGWVAQQYPALIRRMADEGHEIGSHGLEHKRIHTQSRSEFQADIRKSKNLLEDTGGQAVKGYRAATFSITEETLWAYEILTDEGYAYSSSIYPVKHDLYGMPSAPRQPFRPLGPHGALVEYPLPTIRIAGRNWPGGGGGYFRLLPYAYAKWAVRRVNNELNLPFMFYFHPWEVDPDQPRPDTMSAKSQIRHYSNLDKMEQRLRRLLSDFSWGRVDQVFTLHGDTEVLPGKVDTGFPSGNTAMQKLRV